MTRQAACTAIVAVVGIVCTASPAQAGIGKTLVRGLQEFGYQFSGERNNLGDGITINANAAYANRKFNFGLSDLTLNGVVSSSLELTRRGVPAAQFSLNTGNAPLSYNYRINTGAQDLQATGNVLINVNTSINALGFYDQTLQISNRGTYTTDGFVVRDSGTLAFDAGPVSLSGNVFVDVLAAATEPFFAASGTQNPFSKITGRATKAAELSRSADDLRARVQAGEVLSDEEIATLVNNTVLAAMLGGEPTDNLFDKYMLPPGILGEEPLQVDMEAVSPYLAPEPSSLGLLGLALALLPRALRRKIAGKSE